MPTYHYLCSKCDQEFEIVQPITEAPLQTCPKNLCPQKPWGKGKVKRLVSGGAGLLFRGSGFYTTDYRSEGYKSAAKKESEAAGPKKDGGAAAKPEAKSEPKTQPKGDSSKPKDK